jgi:hypothetical protein
MNCKNKKSNAKHSRLCEIHYPYIRYADSTDVRASHRQDCTIGKTTVPLREVNQTLGYEANMHLISLQEFKACMTDSARFGTYVKPTETTHFCVDRGRRTVDGRRLAWLWVYPDGVVTPAHKNMGDKPTMIWTKQDIINAYSAANNATLSMFTRHVDQYSELAITFCLPYK